MATLLVQAPHHVHDDSNTADRKAQGDAPPALVDDIAGRLRPVCGHLPPHDFAALVAEIARTKIRFARREASLPGLSGVWEPAVSDLLEGLGLLAPPGPPTGPNGAK